MPFSRDDLAGPNLPTMVALRDRTGAPDGRQQVSWRRYLTWHNAATLGVVLACVLVIVSALLSGAVLRALQNTYIDAQSTEEGLTAISGLDGDIRLLSQAHQEFLLTGLPRFVDQYNAAHQLMSDVTTYIRSLTIASPDQQRRMDVIEQRLGEDAGELEVAAAAVHPGPGDSMPQALRNRVSLYDSLHDVLADMQREQRRLQATHHQAMQMWTGEIFKVSVLRMIAGVTLIGAVCSLLVCFRLARRALVAQGSDALAGATRALQQEAAGRRQTEQALRERDRMFRGLVDAMPQIVFVLYADGTTEFVSRRWHDYTGASAVWPPGQRWAQFIHPEDEPCVRRRWQQALRQTSELVAEFRLRDKAGAYRWFLAHAVSVVEPEDAEAARWLGTLIDIDDIRRAELALRDSEKRFRHIFEGSPFGMTLSEGEDRLLLQVNPAFCHMLGYAPEELIGRRLVDLSHPDERPEDRAFAQLDGADAGWRVRDKRYLTKQGGTIWARIRVAVFDALGGGGPQLLSVVEDITRQREADEVLRQAQRMEAVGQLSGGIAHDFNNLLGVIIGNIECLLDTMKHDPERADLAREVLDSALDGAELTHRLLAFGRRQALSPQHIDLSGQVARHVAMLSRTLGGTIQVTTQFADDLWPTRVDPSQLGDALLNLSINARDAMPHGGSLTIETYNDRVEENDTAREPETVPGDYVVLAVSDTGVGMSADVRARAVEPFFTTKGPGIGSGLGLSMIYGFARQSDGFLKIASEPGVGTTVCICLPRATGVDETPAGELPRATLPTGHGTILVVDDSAEMRLVAERHLRFLGYSVVTAGNGPAALAVLQAGTPVDLLFTDITMPEGLSGFQLAEAACRMRPDLKVLFTTGYAGAPDPAGMADWPERLIRKPYRRPQLAEKIRMAFTD